MFRRLFLALVVCLGAAAFVRWYGETESVVGPPEHHVQSERAELRTAPADQVPQNETGDDQRGPLTSETAPDIDDLLPDEEAAQPASIAPVFLPAAHVIRFQAEDIGPSDGHRRGTDHPPRA